MYSPNHFEVCPSVALSTFTVTHGRLHNTFQVPKLNLRTH